MAVAYALFASGGSIKWLAVAPAKWTSIGQLADDLGKHASGYVALFIVSTAIFAAGAWAKASSYDLEPPLVALALGLIDRLTMPRVPRVQCIAEKLRC